jgi:uncharacterized membrane protein YccC
MFFSLSRSQIVDLWHSDRSAFWRGVRETLAVAIAVWFVLWVG